MDPIRVTVRRGPLVEAVHRVHAVAVKDGPDRGLRRQSGARHLLPLVVEADPGAAARARARPTSPTIEVAIACASHRAEPQQLEAARNLLDHAPATEADLELGPQEGRGPSLLSHNCSGKHAGFLAVCRVREWPIEGYRLETHPMQQLLLDEVAALAELPRDAIPTAIDGCGVLTFGMSLERMASSFSRLPEVDGGARIVAAMSAHPGLIGYERGATDTDLMRLQPGWIAKGGAEGLICVATAGRSRRRVEGRGREHARAAPGPRHRSLGLGDEFGTVPIESSRGERVGEVSVAMKVHIISDIEGCAGIVKWEQTTAATGRCTRRPASSTPRRSTRPSAARRRRARPRSSSWTVTARADGYTLQLARRRGSRSRL